MPRQDLSKTNHFLDLWDANKTCTPKKAFSHPELMLQEYKTYLLSMASFQVRTVRFFGDSPKDHWTLKTGYLEDPTLAIQVQTLPLEGPRSLGQYWNFGQKITTTPLIKLHSNGPMVLMFRATVTSLVGVFAQRCPDTRPWFGGFLGKLLEQVSPVCKLTWHGWNILSPIIIEV